MSNLFSTYRTCSGKDKVCIANGSLSPVASTSFIPITSFSSLSYVFYVPNFQLNLVSVNHLSPSTVISLFLLIMSFKTWWWNRLLVEAIRSRDCISEWKLLTLLPWNSKHLLLPTFRQLYLNFCSGTTLLATLPFYFAKTISCFMSLSISISSSHCKLVSSHNIVDLHIHYVLVVYLLFLLCIQMYGVLPHVTSLFGYQYFVTFVDDFTSTKWVYLLHAKHEVLYFSVIL